MSMYRIPVTVNVGSPAPGFRARDVIGRDIDTARFLGRGSLVLFFYRNSRCKTCREELAGLADKYSLISEQGGEVIAISADGIDVAKNMAVDLHLPYPVISDPNANIVRLYGVYDDDMDTAYPALFLIDRNGVVRYRKTIEGLNDVVPADEVVNKLKDMGELDGHVPFKSFTYK
jgi:peroxiredoxin Q/BCP